MKARLWPLRVTPLRPLSEAPVALACALVQRRLASDLALISAKPNCTPLKAT